MLAKVLSSDVFGIDAYVVEVEVDIVHGLSSFSSVGLLDGALRKSKDGVNRSISDYGSTCFG